jgi:hypothetical protein
MLLNVTALAQRSPIGYFGYTVIGEPNLMMRVPSIAEWHITFFASPASADIEMSLLLSAKETSHFMPPPSFFCVPT